MDCGREFSEKFSGKIVGKSQKSKKIAKIFGKIFQKNCRKFQKNCRKFRKIVENSEKNYGNPLLLPINLRATLKSFLRALPNPLSKP